MTLEDALVFLAVGQYLHIKGEYPSEEAVSRARTVIHEACMRYQKQKQ